MYLYCDDVLVVGSWARCGDQLLALIVFSFNWWFAIFNFQSFD